MLAGTRTPTVYGN